MCYTTFRSNIRIGISYEAFLSLLLITYLSLAYYWLWPFSNLWYSKYCWDYFIYVFKFHKGQIVCYLGIFSCFLLVKKNGIFDLQCWIFYSIEYNLIFWFMLDTSVNGFVQWKCYWEYYLLKFYNSNGIIFLLYDLLIGNFM
jgi:hypothetical protein